MLVPPKGCHPLCWCEVQLAQVINDVFFEGETALAVRRADSTADGRGQPLSAIEYQGRHGFADKTQPARR